MRLHTILTIFILLALGLPTRAQILNPVSRAKPFAFGSDVITDYGAIGDGKQVGDGAITSGAATLTSATAAFTSGDAGKVITVAGAGAAGVTLSTTILSVTNGTTVVLTANAVTTVSGKNVAWGTDNTTPINNAMTAMAVIGAKKKLFVPAGVYMVGTVIWSPLVSLEGTGFSGYSGALANAVLKGAETTILRSKSAVPLLQCINSASVPYAAGQISNLTLDGNGVGTIGFDAKGLSKMTISRVMTINFTQYGFRWLGVLQSYVHDCLFLYDVIGVDFDVTTITGIGTMQPNFLSFEDCFFYGNTSWGLYGRSFSQCFIRNCNFEVNGTTSTLTTGAIRVSSACPSSEGIGLVIDGAWCESNLGAVIRIDAPGTSSGATHTIRNFQSLVAGHNYGLYVDASSATNQNRIDIQSANFINAATADIGVVGANSTNVFLKMHNVNATLTSLQSAIVTKLDPLGNQFIPGTLGVTGVSTFTGVIDASGAGNLKVPALSTTARTALNPGAAGAIVWDSTLYQLYGWNGTAWVVFGAAGTPPSGTTLFSDAYTGTNGTALASHTPLIGAAGTAVLGTWTIQSNTGVPTTGTTNGLFIYDAASSGNLTLQADIVVGLDAGGEHYGGLVFRYSDSSNYWYFQPRVTTTPTNGYDLIKVTAGSATIFATLTAGGSIGNGSAITLKVVANGTSIALYAGPNAGSLVQVGTTQTSSFNQTATKFGFITGTATEHDTWDNVTLTTP